MKVPKFTAEMVMINDAFGTTEAERRREISRILRNLAVAIDKGDEDSGTLRDTNGNQVGRFKMEEV